MKPLALAANSTFLSVYLCDGSLSCPWPAAEEFLLTLSLLFLLELSFMHTFPFTLLCDQSLHFHCKQLNYHEVAKRSNGQHAFIPSQTAEPENTSLQMNISLVVLVIFFPLLLWEPTMPKLQLPSVIARTVPEFLQ